MPTASTPSLVAFMLIVAFVVGAWVWAVGQIPGEGQIRRMGRALAAASAWMGLTAAPITTGFITPETAIPRLPILFSVLLLVAFALPWTGLGKRLTAAVPIAALVGFQAFRFPLELVLHSWVQQGVAPPQMTWTGQNFDIVAGFACLILATLAERHRWAAWLAQVVGGVLILNVLRIVFLSLPTPMQAFEQEILLPFAVPTIWIGTVCVVAALIGHGLLMRKLLQPS